MLFVLGLFSDYPVAYSFVLFSCIFPTCIWLYFGAAGIPIFPAVSALYFVYYGLPIFRGSVGNYDSSEIQRGAGTIALFLICASLSWVVSETLRRGRKPRGDDAASDSQVKTLVILGLSAGIFYYVSSVVGWSDFLGAYFGVFRSITLTFASVACYLLGYARGRGILAGGMFMVSLLEIIILVFLAWSSLFLITGVLNIAAALLGYIITKKRIPWIPIVVIFVFATVLHAGKEAMRKDNWAAGSQSNMMSTITTIPSLMVDWVGTGIGELATGRKQEGGLIERTSLLNMLLIVQHATPESVSYLDGETYLFLSSTLMPRFLDPDKAISQSGLNLLSVHYGLQTADSTRNTTLAWGIPAEAYANFGYLGIIGSALIFGALCAFFMRMSVGVSPISFQMLVAISATINLINIEADFSYLLLNILQSVVAVALFLVPMKMFRGNILPSQRTPLHGAARTSLTRRR